MSIYTTIFVFKFMHPKFETWCIVLQLIAYFVKFNGYLCKYSPSMEFDQWQTLNIYMLMVISRVRFSKNTMGRLRYLGWDFASIHWENSDISDEIVSACIE